MVSWQAVASFRECFVIRQCNILVTCLCDNFVGPCPAYKGKDIVFRFIIEYSSLMEFCPQVVGLFLYEDF